MRFSLQTILLSFLLIWSALAALGVGGIAVAAILLGAVVYARNAQSLAVAVINVLGMAAVLLVMTGCCLLGIVFRPNSTAKEAEHRADCRKNLQRIATALHQYHEFYGSFPPAYFTDEKGKPAHSWRVLLLPFLDPSSAFSGVYNGHYDFEEPWDGTNNTQFTSWWFPYDYACPGDSGYPYGPMTDYVAVVGPNTAWPQAECRKLSDFGDSADRTIMLMEVANSGIQWTEPRDLSPEDVVRGLHRQGPVRIWSHRVGWFRYFRHGTQGVHVAMADGGVRFVSDAVDYQTLKPLFLVGENSSGDPNALPSGSRPHWRHIIGLTMLVVSFFLLVLRPRQLPDRLQDPAPPRPPLLLTCSHCGRWIGVGREYDGQTGLCPRCGRQLTVPPTTSEEPASP